MYLNLIVAPQSKSKDAVSQLLKVRNLFAVLSASSAFIRQFWTASWQEQLRESERDKTLLANKVQQIEKEVSCLYRATFSRIDKRRVRETLPSVIFACVESRSPGFGLQEEELRSTVDATRLQFAELGFNADINRYVRLHHA